jgi:hypothetical protein
VNEILIVALLRWKQNKEFLLTSFSKVFEKVIYNRLLEHLNSNNIFVEEQFRFRKEFTTEKASYEIINDILSALIDKLIVGGIFCDLAKLLIVLIMIFCYRNKISMELEAKLMNGSNHTLKTGTKEWR